MTLSLLNYHPASLPTPFCVFGINKRSCCEMCGISVDFHCECIILSHKRAINVVFYNCLVLINGECMWCARFVVLELCDRHQFFSLTFPNVQWFHYQAYKQLPTRAKSFQLVKTLLRVVLSGDLRGRTPWPLSRMEVRRCTYKAGLCYILSTGPAVGSALLLLQLVPILLPAEGIWGSETCWEEFIS